MVAEDQQQKPVKFMVTQTRPGIVTFETGPDCEITRLTVHFDDGDIIWQRVNDG
mgnify:CR=1 FL=1